MGMRERQGRFVGFAALGAALIAAVAISQSPVPSASAAPASPVLEFAAPSFPVAFTAEGGAVTAVLAGFDTVVHCEASAGSGQITGPRSTLSSYVFTGCNTQSGSESGRECQSTGAAPEEIRSGQIEADLVFINQFTRQVGMLLAPHGGVYLSFECGGEAVRAIGPFLSPVGPINQVASSFSATLDRVGSTQVPDQYEGPAGESLAAVPSGERGTEPPASTGVKLAFAIHTAVPIEVKALSAADVELARVNDELTALVAKNHQAEAARAAAEKRARDETAAREALERKLREEQALAKERTQKRSQALRLCRKLKPGHARTRCESRAKKKYAPPPVAVARRA
jgi:predicted small secreted protein